MTNDTTMKSGESTDIATRARNLITGLWSGQALYAGVKLGMFEVLTYDATPSDEIANELGLDPDYSYRLLRALGSVGVVNEDDSRSFSLTPLGALFQKDQTPSLRANILLAHSPTMLAAWKHLPAIVKEGGPDGFAREFNTTIFEYSERNPEFAQTFNASMTASSKIQTAWVLDALSSYDFAPFSQVCDVGGGHGHLLCSLLAANPHLEGTVLDRPSVIAEEDRLWASKLGVEDRCTFTEGDMFDDVPPADVYLLKMILHDWTDEECIQILSNVREAAPSDGRLFVIERIVPDTETAHFSKMYDINMMVATGGRERTFSEYSAILEQAGWDCIETWLPEDGTMRVLEGKPS